MPAERRASAVLVVVLVLSLVGCGSTATFPKATANQAGQQSSVTGGQLGGATPGASTPEPLGASSPTSPGDLTFPTDAAGSSATPSPHPSALRTSGRGWTEMEVYLGVLTTDAAEGSSTAAGLDPSSVVRAVSAIAHEVNARGGVFGRRLVPLFHQEQSAGLLVSADARSQASCDYFAQQVKVIAVLSLVGAADTERLQSCLRAWQLPLIGMDSLLRDDQSLQDAGRYVLAQHASLTQLPAHWLARLMAEGYFDGTAKLGIVSDSSAAGQRFVNRLADLADANHLTVVKALTYGGSASSSVASVEQAFAAAGVTHVLMVPATSADALTFMQRAEEQGFRPRYALSSYLAPQQLALSAPVAQLHDAVGIGWSPGLDVDDAHDSGSSAERACLAVLKRGGVTFTSSQRAAKAAGFAMCDALSITLGGARHAVRLDPAGLLLGVTGLGSGFPVGVAFGNGLTPLHRTLTASSRDLHFDAACRCFAYAGPVHSF